MEDFEMTDEHLLIPNKIQILYGGYRRNNYLQLPKDGEDSYSILDALLLTKRKTLLGKSKKEAAELVEGDSLIEYFVEELKRGNRQVTEIPVRGKFDVFDINGEYNLYRKRFAVHLSHVDTGRFFKVLNPLFKGISDLRRNLELSLNEETRRRKLILSKSHLLPENIDLEYINEDDVKNFLIRNADYLTHSEGIETYIAEFNLTNLNKDARFEKLTGETRAIDDIIDLSRMDESDHRNSMMWLKIEFLSSLLSQNYEKTSKIKKEIDKKEKINLSSS